MADPKENVFYTVDEAGNPVELMPFEDQRKAYFIYDGDEILSGVSILSVDVIEDSRITDSPTESGVIISDHRIFNPLEITVKCALPESEWENAYNAIARIYVQNSSELMKIKSQAQVYSNLQLVGLPHKETAENVSRLVFDLKFRSILTVTPAYVDMPKEVVKTPASAATVDAGEKQAVAPVKPRMFTNSQGYTFYY